VALLGLGLDVTALLHEQHVRTRKSGGGIDLRPLLDEALLSSGANDGRSLPNVRRLFVGLGSVPTAATAAGASSASPPLTLVLGSHDDINQAGTIDWPPPLSREAEATEDGATIVRWAYYGTLMDVTSEVGARINGQARARFSVAEVAAEIQNKTLGVVAASPLSSAWGRGTTLFVRYSSSALEPAAATTTGEAALLVAVELTALVVKGGESVEVPTTALCAKTKPRPAALTWFPYAPSTLVLTLSSRSDSCRHVRVRTEDISVVVPEGEKRATIDEEEEEEGRLPSTTPICFWQGRGNDGLLRLVPAFDGNGKRVLDIVEEDTASLTIEERRCRRRVDIGNHPWNGDDCLAYSNGQEAVLLLQPPAEDHSAGAASAESILLSFALSSFMAESDEDEDVGYGLPVLSKGGSKSNPLLSGLQALTYDPINNLVWGVVVASMGGGLVLRRWRNPGMPPALPYEEGVAHTTVGGSIATSQQALASIPSSWEHLRCPRAAAVFVVAHCDRLAKHFLNGLRQRDQCDTGNGALRSPFSDAASSRKRAFVYDLRPSTFAYLTALVQEHHHGAHDDDNTGDTEGLEFYVVLAALRLLRVNVHYVASDKSLMPRHCVGPKAMRMKLLALVMTLIDTTSSSPAVPSLKQGYSAQIQHKRAIQQEALKLFVVGIDLFYPSGDAQARLLASYLRGFATRTQSPAEAAILRMLLEKLRDLPSIANLFEEVSAFSEAAAEGIGSDAARSRRGLRTMSISSNGSGGSPPTSSLPPLTDLMQVMLELCAKDSV